MSRMALVIAFVLASIGPASAQKAEIEAANAKYTEFYNKGDFAGMASLYTDDAMALPNVLRWCRAERRSRQCGKASWPNTLAMRNSQPWTSSRTVSPLHARSGLSA